MAKEIQIFSNPSFGEIRTAGTSEEPLFCLADLCHAIGIKDVSRCASRLDEDVRLTHPLWTKGGVQQSIFVTEAGMYDVIIRSDSERAKPFRKWVTSEVLPALRKHGEYSSRNKSKQRTPTLTSQVAAGTRWVKEVSKILKLNDVSKLQLLEKVGEPLGLPVPDYVQSKGTLKSATDLLSEYGVKLSAHQFNDIAVKKGFLEKIERMSSKGKKKKFNSITKKGLEYGENLINKNNANETQPKWYVSRFGELISALGLSKEMEVSHAG